jgi:hypothetical protein
MQYSTQTVTNLSESLASIARIASTHGYFAEHFALAALPPAQMAAIGAIPGTYEKLHTYLATMRWTTVTTSEDNRIVGFAATHEAQHVTKAINIAWFFVAPTHREGGERVLLQHIEQHDAAGCAELAFEAELNIELWRRLLRHGYRPESPRSFARGPHNTVIAVEVLAVGMKYLGMSPPDNWADTERKLRAHQTLVDNAIALINDDLTTVDTFRARYPVLIQPGSTVPTMTFIKLLMPGRLILPMGPTAAATLESC